MNQLKGLITPLQSPLPSGRHSQSFVEARVWPLPF